MFYEEDYEYIQGNLDFTGTSFSVIEEDADPWNDDERFEFIHQEDYRLSDADWEN